jgi:hypothetical protein
LAAADALSDAPISTSLIFMSWDDVSALVETKSDLGTVLESTSLKQTDMHQIVEILMI